MPLSDEEVSAGGIPDSEVSGVTQSASTGRSAADEAANVMSVVNEKHIASALGLPVDLVNAGLKKIGIGADKPFAGSESIRSGMRALGMSHPEAKPETTAGHIATEVLGGAATAPIMGGGLGGVARGIGGAIASPALQSTGRVLAAPGPNIAAGTGGGAGGTLAQEATGGPGTSDMAKLAGELVGGALGGLAPGARLRPSRSADPVIEAYERLGLAPSAAEAGVGGRAVQWAEGNLLPQTLGGGGVMDRFKKQRLQEITNVQEEIAAAYGTPKPRAEMGGEIQNSVMAQWLAAKNTAGEVIGTIKDKYATEAVYPQNLIDAITKPVGAASTGPVRSTTLDPLVTEAAALIRETAGNLTMADLAALKTKYGYALEPGFHKNVNDAQVAQLFGAVRSDIEQFVKAKSPDDFRALSEANASYAKAMDSFKQNFKKLLGTKDVPVSSERAFEIVTGAATERGRGDLREFTAVWDALPKDTQGNLAATILTRLGAADRSKPSNPETFSLGQFLTQYRNLAPEAKELLFKKTGTTETQQALDDLVSVAHNVQEKLAKLASTSRSGTGSIMMGQLGAGAALGNVFAGDLSGLLYTIGGPYVAAQLFTNPKAVRALTATLHATGTAMDANTRTMLTLEALPRIGEGAEPKNNRRTPSIIERRESTMPRYGVPDTWEGLGR